MRSPPAKAAAHPASSRLEPADNPGKDRHKIDREVLRGLSEARTVVGRVSIAINEQLRHDRLDLDGGASGSKDPDRG